MKIRSFLSAPRRAKKFLSFYVFLLSFLLFATNAFAQDPAQYGTPFANVPDPRDVNLYQVHIRPYSAAGNFAGVITRLDAIKALGTNVIYLMPIYPHGTDPRSSASPYSIRDFKSVATEYGTLADLRTLVDGAHSRGMAVMLDFAVNGTSWDHPWITQHPDWYNQAGGTIQQLASFPDVAGLNFSNNTMRAAIVDAMRYWIFAANIDGYRCDFANNPPLDFWTNTINNLRGITSHKILMFAEGDRTTNFNAGFDLNFGDKWYYDAIKAIANGTSVAQIKNYYRYRIRTRWCDSTSGAVYLEP
jgi:glycosidase